MENTISCLWVLKNICNTYYMLKINVFCLPRTLCTGFLTSVYFASLQSLHHSALDQVCLYIFFHVSLYIKGQVFLHLHYVSKSLVQNFTLAVNQKVRLVPLSFWRFFLCTIYCFFFFVSCFTLNINQLFIHLHHWSGLIDWLWFIWGNKELLMFDVTLMKYCCNSVDPLLKSWGKNMLP